MAQTGGRRHERHRGSVPTAGREVIEQRLVLLRRDAELPEVVAALAPPGRLAGSLHGRQKHPDQDDKDPDDDQQLDERETM